MIFTDKEKETLSQSLDQFEKEFNKKAKEDKRTIWSISRIEGSMMATDYWCARYINVPTGIRYNIVTPLIGKWSFCRLGRFLTFKKIEREEKHGRKNKQK